MASEACTPASEPAAVEAGPDVKYSYHVFISYRVATDGALAEKLCDKLQLQSLPNEADMKVRCFLDKQSLKLGTEYDQDFLNALHSSCLFIPLISSAALKPLESAKEGVRDNVILEWEVALRLREAGQLDILPLLVGEVSHTDGSYSRFSAFNVARFPAVASATDASTNVQETVRRMLRLQGSFLNPTELLDKLPSIVSFLGTHVWPKARDKWADKERLEPEREFTCVQCGAGYLESANGAGSCRFHERGMYNGAHFCCGAACGSAVDELKAGQETGCRRSRHRPKHHNDYTWVR